MTTYTLDILIALADGEKPTQRWWTKRYQWGARRAGGMPPEIVDALNATRKRQTDPETHERFACVTLPLPAGTPLGRATELAHLLISTLAAEGYTLRSAGKRVEILPGDHSPEPAGTQGGPDFATGRVCSSGCLTCVFASDTRLGCCTQGAAFSLADIGAALLAEDEQVVAKILTLPGKMDGSKWHPYLVGGACVFHARDSGCTLARDRMPLQCRTYLCRPEQLLPAAMLAAYEPYVADLEDQEAFVEEHMRQQGGVDFGSPLAALKEAAVQAFAALAANGAAPRPEE